MSLYLLEFLPPMFLSGVVVGGALATTLVFLISAILNFRSPEKSVADLLLAGVALVCVVLILKYEGIV